jgi:hypothetical protein
METVSDAEGVAFAWSARRRKVLGVLLVAAAAAQTVAGVLHPEDSPAGMVQSVWVPIHTVFFITLFISLLGVIHIYGLISTESGWLALATVVLFAFGIVGFEGLMLLELGVLPILANSEGTIGLLEMTGPLFAGPLGSWLVLIAIAFSLGSIAFGLMLRSSGLPKWAGPCLGAAPLFAFSPPIPLVVAKVGLVIYGVGFAGLGWGLSRIDHPATA